MFDLMVARQTSSASLKSEAVTVATLPTSPSTWKPSLEFVACEHPLVSFAWVVLLRKAVKNAAKVTHWAVAASAAVIARQQPFAIALATFEALFSFGSGPIKGFSVTLMIGIITSMFTAIVITKYLVLAYSKKRDIKNYIFQD